MVEQYLGKETADDIFFSAFLTGILPEKKASEMQKSAKINFSHLLGSIGELGGGVAKSIKEVLPMLGAVALGGAATGALGSTVYDILKERVSQEDPEKKFNDDIEAMYRHRTRELEDAKWMGRVRALRDELKRGYKKMPTDEYRTKYKALMDALNERSA